MRKIEEQMCDVIRNAPAYGCSKKNVGNMSVQTNHIGSVYVYLHGNLIAIKHRSEPWQITLAGWNTRTTRSRLTAIISNAAATIRPGWHELDPLPYQHGLGVSSRQGAAFIHDARGKTQIDDSGWFPVVLF